MRYDHHSMLPERAFQPRAKGPFGHCLGMTREGGKGGGSAPKPDPNIGKAQLQLAQLAEEQWNTFTSQIWPEIKEQYYAQDARAAEQFEMDKALQEKQIAIADEEYARRRDVFRPIEDQQIAEAKAAGGAADQERYAALALGDTRDATNRAARDAEMRMQSYGIDPTSGRYQGMMRAMDVNNSAIEAAAATRARTAAEQLGWAKRMDVLGIGAGQFGNQATSTNLALSAGGQALGAGQSMYSNASALGGSWNSGATSAMSGWNSIGTMGVQKYNADVNAYAARTNAQGEMGGALIGGAATIGAAFI